MRRTIEINGNLDGKDGLSNYEDFESVINEVLGFYRKHFDENVMSAIDLYIDIFDLMRYIIVIRRKHTNEKCNQPMPGMRQQA